MIKRLYLSVILALTAWSCLSAQMLVGTYNIRYKNDGDSTRGNVWSKRCQVIADQVNFMAPVVLGVQEALLVQLQDLQSELDGYEYIGVGRDDGKTGGEYAAILYKTDQVRLLDHGDFWLNQSPDRPALGWDAACIRICTWGKFTGQTATDDEAFYFFNLHMDHVGVTARRESAKLILKKIREIAGNLPVIVTGDFNVDQNDEIYGLFTGSGMLVDSYQVARQRFAENGTFNSFDTDLYTESRIDHVMVSPSIRVDSYGILTNSYWTPDEGSAATLNGHDAPQEIDFSRYVRRQPSDHYPVFVRLSVR